MAAERLDVDVDVELVIAVAEGGDGVFEFGGLAMGFAERKILVDLQMEFDEEIVVLLVRGNVVNRMAHALGDGANGFEEVFVVGGARFGVYDDISGNDLADALLDGVGERVDTLEIGGARDGDGGVHKVAIAGAPDAHALHAKHAVHPADGIGDFVLQAFGSGVEKSVERAAAELRAEPENHARDRERGEGVRVRQPGKIPGIARPNKRHAKNDDDRAPDIGGEMESVGFQRFADVLLRYFVEGTGAREVNGQGGAENQDGGETGLNVDGMKEQAIERFVDDVKGGDDEQAGFQEGGEVFKFAVTVRMARVGRLVGDTDGKKGNDGGDEVQTGMEGFGENAKAARCATRGRSSGKGAASRNRC